MKNDVLSKTITFLRFPLMAGIVLIHFDISNGFTLHNFTYGGGSPEWYRAIIYLFCDILPRIGVPLFFFFSGFLFFYHTEWTAEAYKQKLKRRARTLLVPYILWNIIAIAWQGFRSLPFLSKFFPNASDTAINWSFTAIANAFWDNNHHGMFMHTAADVTGEITNSIFPIDVPLWYVRDLMIVIICAPFLYLLVKKAGYFFIAILGLAWYLLEPYDFGYPNQLLTAFFFFSWGAYYSIRQLDFTVLFRKVSHLPILYVMAVVADLLTRGQSFNIYIHDIGILLGVVSAIIITASLLEKGRVRVHPFLAEASFFIFALHKMILYDVGKMILTPIRCDSPYFLIGFYFLVPAVTILICLGLYKLLKKYLPRFTFVLTGGR